MSGENVTCNWHGRKVGEHSAFRCRPALNATEMDRRASTSISASECHQEKLSSAQFCTPCIVRRTGEVIGVLLATGEFNAFTITVSVSSKGLIPTRTAFSAFIYTKSIPLGLDSLHTGSCGFLTDTTCAQETFPDNENLEHLSVLGCVTSGAADWFGWRWQFDLWSTERVPNERGNHGRRGNCGQASTSNQGVSSTCGTGN